MTEPRTAAGRALYYIHGSEAMRDAILVIEAEARVFAQAEDSRATARLVAEARTAALDEARAAVDELHANENGCNQVEVCRALAAIDALREGADKT